MRGAWVSGILMKNNSNADLHTGARHKSCVNVLKQCIRPLCERGYSRTDVIKKTIGVGSNTWLA